MSDVHAIYLTDWADQKGMYIKLGSQQDRNAVPQNQNVNRTTGYSTQARCTKRMYAPGMNRALSLLQDDGLQARQ